MGAEVGAGRHIGRPTGGPNASESDACLSSSPQTTLDVHLLPATASLSVLSSLSPPSVVAIRNLNSLNKAAMLLKSVVSTAAGSRKHFGEGPTALGFGVGASIGTLSVPQRWVARTTPAPDAVELHSDWVREPIRLVHAAATQPVRHEDCSERSETTNGG